MSIPGDDPKSRGLREAGGREQTLHQDQLDKFFHNPAVKLSHRIMQPPCQRDCADESNGRSIPLQSAGDSEALHATALSNFDRIVSRAGRGVSVTPRCVPDVTAAHY